MRRGIITIEQHAMPDVLRRQFDEIVHLAADSRLAFAAVVYGVQDRGEIHNYVTTIGHNRRGMSERMGRALLRLAMLLLGGSEPTLQIIPIVAAEPPPKGATVH